MNVHAYIFLVSYGPDGPYADSVLDATAALDQTPETYQQVVATAKRIGVDSPELEELAGRLAGISLRARITNRSLHKVMTDEPLSWDELDTLLRHKQDERTLKQFLKESAI